MEGLKQQASGGALQSRTPLVKSQTLGGPPIRPPDGVSCGSSAVFPPTCSLGTLLTFQWQGCLAFPPTWALLTFQWQGCLLCVLFLPQMQALPNRHAPQGHPGPRTPTGGPCTHHQFPNHQTVPLHVVPYSVPAVTRVLLVPDQHQCSTKPSPPAPQFQRHDSPYSSPAQLNQGLCA